MRERNKGEGHIYENKPYFRGISPIIHVSNESGGWLHYLVDIQVSGWEKI